MLAIVLGFPLWITYIAVRDNRFQEWVRYTDLLSWINRSFDGLTPYELRLVAAGTAVFVLSFILSIMIHIIIFRLAFAPQLDDDLPDDVALPLKKLAASRRGGKLFEPDYRAQGWNQSRYAPKNRKSQGMGMTAWAIAYIVALPLAGLGILFRLNVILTFVSVWFVWSMTLICSITLIRRREWRSIMRGLISSDQSTQDKPNSLSINQLPLESAAPGSPSLTEPRFEFKIAPRVVPKLFEQEVADLISYQTGHKAVPVGGSGDRGVDIKVFDKDDRLIGIVQCKRYAPGKPLAPMFIREASACKRDFGVGTAYLVTTARFSEDARVEAKRLGVELLDGDDLERMRRQIQGRQYRSF